MNCQRRSQLKPHQCFWPPMRRQTPKAGRTVKFEMELCGSEQLVEESISLLEVSRSDSSKPRPSSIDVRQQLIST
eukprot:scaffold24390_cov144-Skeletonema_menzelii.AAC.11